MIDSDVKEIRDHYRSLVQEWKNVRSTPKKANKVFDRIHSYFKEIRATSAGQEALRSLLSDPDEEVRLKAGAHSLWFSPLEAELVLRDLADSQTGLVGFTAEITLEQFHQGKLDLDW